MLSNELRDRVPNDMFEWMISCGKPIVKSSLGPRIA
jgi:hypothetical protein